MFFHTFLNPSFWEQNLSKTPLQTWWDLKDIAQQDREKSSFLIIWNCYTRGYTDTHCPVLLAQSSEHFPHTYSKIYMTSETLMKGIFSKYCHFGCYSRYILYKLVSQATVFVTSHNTTPHEREGKGEERCVTRQKRGGGILLIIFCAGSWQHNSGPRKGNNYLAAWLVSTLIKTLNFVSVSLFEFWEFFFAMWPKFRSC